MYRPDARALALLQQDVLDPWLAGTSITRSGRFAARGKRAQTVTIRTPLDGELTVSVSGNARLVGPPTRRACGARTASFRVVRWGAGGRFRLTVSRP